MLEAFNEPLGIGSAGGTLCPEPERAHEALRDTFGLGPAQGITARTSRATSLSLIPASAIYCGPSRSGSSRRGRSPCATRGRRAAPLPNRPEPGQRFPELDHVRLEQLVGMVVAGAEEVQSIVRPVLIRAAPRGVQVWNDAVAHDSTTSFSIPVSAKREG